MNDCEISKSSWQKPSQFMKDWKVNAIPLYIVSDFSLYMNVVLAVERYLAVCHPLFTVRHPAMKKSSIYIAWAIVFTFIKDIGLCTRFVCHHWDWIACPDMTRGYTISYIFSWSLTYLTVGFLIILCILTIVKLKMKNNDRDLARQNLPTEAENSIIENKLVLICLINSILAIISEMNSYIFLLVTWIKYELITCQTIHWCLLILNNVFNFPVYMIILQFNCIKIKIVNTF